MSTAGDIWVTGGRPVRPPRLRESRLFQAAVAVLVLLVVAGLLLIWAGLHKPVPPPDAPEPSAPFSVTYPRVGTETAPPANKAAAAYPGKDRLYIPSVGVDAPLVGEPAPDGVLVVPGDPATVGLYLGRPGVSAKRGTTLLAGHVTYGPQQGALRPLSDVGPGALVVTTDERGRAHSWRVAALEVKAKDDLPQFPADGARRLVVVTCGGPVKTEADGSRYYRDNVIMTAVPQAEAAANS